ncbi:MAG: Hsp20/alpha crystallin family protein [Desulfobacteraceae bacterium]|jgi:HSP20 family protein
MLDNKELQVTDKKEAEVKGELTHEGPVFAPAVDILENSEALVLIADMPGVSSEGVEIYLKDNELTISGRVRSAKPDASIIYKEYDSGNYLRKFTLSSVIDQGKIQASMKNGVLRVALPKAEAVKPRKITVKAG